MNHLPTIPASDASSVMSGPTSARRKSTSTLRSGSCEKDSPPQNRAGSTRSKHKAYSTHHPPQPQSLNAAVELLSSPPRPGTSTSMRNGAGIKPELSGMSYDDFWGEPPTKHPQGKNNLLLTWLYRRNLPTSVRRSPSPPLLLNRLGARHHLSSFMAKKSVHQ